MHFSMCLFVFCWQTLIGSKWNQSLHTFEFARQNNSESRENMLFLFVTMALDAFAEEKDCDFLQNHFDVEFLVQFHLNSTTLCHDMPGGKQKYPMCCGYLNPRSWYSLCVCLCFLGFMYGLDSLEFILACNILFSAGKR